MIISEIEGWSEDGLNDTVVHVREREQQQTCMRTVSGTVLVYNCAVQWIICDTGSPFVVRLNLER